MEAKQPGTQLFLPQFYFYIQRYIFDSELFLAANSVLSLHKQHVLFSFSCSSRLTHLAADV